MSKKLQGNGLWESSRMMLPQHKEQSMLLSHPQPAAAPEPPTQKELELMRDFIILPVALGIVEKKRRETEMSSLTLKILYSAAAKVLVKSIQEDVQQSRKALVEKQIRVFEDSKDASEIVYRYVCRGYENRFVMTKDYMRSEVSVRIERYVRNLASALQEVNRKPS
ncbi:hypothetical protein RAC89_22660 [Paenibacillus sp. GD4]|jgi:hypothetical protein|uniref:hypothetical protein n=1 Tax=Paenibacillus sp. GD4 TaxID=3068890 RepID=UPI002796D3E3|nr:hypothetical protein [Paenibacillus sp. GD4]MDQ1913202.1 hypothetical protein [Paenibacillus sp. GD4]